MGQVAASGSGNRTHGRLVWFVLVIPLIIAAVAAYAIVGQGQQIGSLEVGPSGTVKVGFVEKTTTVAVKQGQAEIKQRGAAIVQEVRQTAPATSAAVPQIGGEWNSDIGARYEIQQYADRVVIQEVTQYGITGVGQGVVGPGGVNFTYEAVTGVTGQGQLAFNGANEMTATFYPTGGQPATARLTR